MFAINGILKVKELVTTFSTIGLIRRYVLRTHYVCDMAVTQRNTALLQRTLESNRRATYTQGPQRGGPYLE